LVAGFRSDRDAAEYGLENGADALKEILEEELQSKKHVLENELRARQATATCLLSINKDLVLLYDLVEFLVLWAQIRM